MSLERLRTLLEVAQAGSIAGAAQGDATRQSLYSRQIKELEAFFGIELCRKKGRVLTLTPAGQELTKHINGAFCALDDFKCRAQNSLYRSVLGCGDSLHAWMVAPVMQQLAQEKKPWQFSFSNLRNKDVNKGLINRDVDFGLLRSSDIKTSVLEHKKVCEVGYALYVPKGLMPKRGKADLPALLEQVPVACMGGQ